jgi:hypothetical protein
MWDSFPHLAMRPPDMGHPVFGAGVGGKQIFSALAFYSLLPIPYSLYYRGVDGAGLPLGGFLDEAFEDGA